MANQLWNYASIYAYALERNAELTNPSFFEYGEYLNMRATPNTLFRILFFLPFRNYTKRKTSFKRKVWRRFYAWYAALVLCIADGKVVYADPRDPRPHYLPPSAATEQTIDSIEKTSDTIYFYGWLFRNPVGLEKYRREIAEHFAPRRDIQESVARDVKGLRENYAYIVGVHVRQGDYKNWRGGKYFVEQKRVRKILDEYLIKSGKDAEQTCFIVTSDGPIATDLFKGLHIFVSKDNAVHDLFLLSKTDVVIGANSTFGAFASYYGNIPFVVMTNEEMDWDYYADKNKYFENKYSTLVFY